MRLLPPAYCYLKLYARDKEVNVKIRSITYFDRLAWPFNEQVFVQIRDCIRHTREAYVDQGFEVQTTRLASAPFPLVLLDLPAKEAVNYAQALEYNAGQSGFDYVSIGPALPSHLEHYQVIPEVLKNTNNVFAAGIISSNVGGISTQAIKQCASVIKENADISQDGFGNLRFAALANVPAGSPFLPAAFHEPGEKPGFAIATEAADLAVDSFANAKCLENARQALTDRIEEKSSLLTQIGKDLADRFEVQFFGIDFSFAPFPSRSLSIGSAVEYLGVPGIGNHGTLTAIAICAEAIDRANFPKVGFNGVLLPVLEDTVLADGAVTGLLTINDLLLYSTVCGTGLDTIPLPGSVSEDLLYAVLLDLAALAQRLGKALTARLMPIPGKLAGEMTEFDFEFFTNSKVMNLKAEKLSGHLAEDVEFSLETRTTQVQEKD